MSSAVRLGLVAGLLATIVMDVAMVGTLRLLAMPSGVFFSFVGEAMAAFVALLGIGLSGSVALGAALHYLIGLVLGAIFVAALRAGILPADMAWKVIIVAVVYVQAASLLLLVPAVRLLDLGPAEVQNLFGLAVVFHGVWGVVMGTACLYGTRTDERAAKA